MTLSTRLTRAGLVILVFGVICAVLPSTPITYASTNHCSTPNDDVIIGAVVVAGVGGYEWFQATDKDRKNHHNQDNGGNQSDGNTH